MSTLLTSLKDTLNANHNKIPISFVDQVVEDSNVLYLHPTANMRICIVTLDTGHEVVGVAQVIDAANDVETIGNKVALDRAKSELWKVLGAIAISIKD